MFVFIKFYVYLISQYSEAGLIQKCKNSTQRVAMVSGDDGASSDRQSSSCSCTSARLVDPPAQCLVSQTGSADRLTDTVARVTGRKRRRSVHHLSSTTCCRSELRGVDDHSLLFWPTLLMNTCCSYQRCWWTRDVLTNVADEHVLFLPTLLMNTCCSYQRCWWTRAVLTNIADEHVRWRRRTAGST